VQQKDWKDNFTKVCNLITYMQGGRQKIFRGGGATEKKQKLAKIPKNTLPG